MIKLRELRELRELGELRELLAQRNEVRELREKRELIIFGYKAQEIPPKISPHPLGEKNLIEDNEGRIGGFGITANISGENSSQKVEERK
ncbi:MAG: hypothetical protein F6K31_26665 [Symploca sp. SIO2G7]|nr:hypothetical protein [Symploca sp. SIO2G7]